MLEQIDNDFNWLINSDFDDAMVIMAEQFSPYYLYPYYMDGKNYFKTDDFDIYRIHVRVENSVIVSINGIG